MSSSDRISLLRGVDRPGLHRDVLAAGALQ